MRNITKYVSLAAILGADIALASPLGRELVKKYLMPNTLEERYLARTLFGEGRGASKELKIGMANVIKNRVKDPRWGDSVREVILKRKHFSCLNPENPNWDKVWNPEQYNPQAWQECLQLAKEIQRGVYSDNTKGANHYHTIDVNPKWSRGKKPTVRVGNTKFFKL